MADALADMTTACIAMGSNLGDRAGTLRSALRAIGALPGTRVARVSSFIQTPAWAPPESIAAGVDPGGPYLNGAAVVETTLPARELLAAMLEIERRHGRERSPENRWGARTLDLDLLLYGDAVIDGPDLVVPHPRMHERLFVLEPLAEIAADMMAPGRGRVGELLARLRESTGRAAGGARG